MNCYENLKNNLKTLRLQNRETQIELATKINIPRANYSRYETGENVPPLDVIVILAEYFNVSVDFLLGLKVDI